MTIIAIMGTNGSGKSTLIRQLLEKSPARQELKDEYDEVAGYWLPEWDTRVLGPYPEGLTVGGCDKIAGHPLPNKHTGKIERGLKGGIARVDELVRQYAPLGKVVFEGLLICYWKRWRAVSEAFPGRYVWAALDTPLEVCLARIQARSQREYAGEDLERLHKNVGSKFKDVVDIMRIAEENGERTVWLDHKNPLPQLLELLAEPTKIPGSAAVVSESTQDYRALSLF